MDIETISKLAFGLVSASGMIAQSKGSELLIFEVEDTNPVTPVKLRKLSEIWFRLDSIGWDFRVFLIDRYMDKWSILPLSKIWYTLEFDTPYRRSPKDVGKTTSKSEDWHNIYYKLKNGHVLGNDGWV